jgi:hypothetical protein
MPERGCIPRSRRLRAMGGEAACFPYTMAHSRPRAPSPVRGRRARGCPDGVVHHDASVATDRPVGRRRQIARWAGGGRSPGGPAAADRPLGRRRQIARWAGGGRSPGPLAAPAPPVILRSRTPRLARRGSRKMHIPGISGGHPQVGMVQIVPRSPAMSWFAIRAGSAERRHGSEVADDAIAGHPQGTLGRLCPHYCHVAATRSRARFGTRPPGARRTGGDPGGPREVIRHGRPADPAGG